MSGRETSEGGVVFSCRYESSFNFWQDASNWHSRTLPDRHPEVCKRPEEERLQLEFAKLGRELSVFGNSGTIVLHHRLSAGVPCSIAICLYVGCVSV